MHAGNLRTLRLRRDEPAGNIATCEKIFADHLGGHSLMTNAKHIRGSAWIRFPRVLCEKWSHENVVLMGDAAATAHFSIGSGTKLALESAIALADYLHSEPTLEGAFDKYEEERRLEVLALQSAARNSLEWFEEIERYLHLDPVQFNYSLLTRSQRISHENLRLRDPIGWKRRALVPDPGRACRADNAPCARADVRALQAARDAAQEPHRGLADGAVQGRGRLPDRLAPGALRRARQGRRRPGLYRDDLRQPEGRITPGCPGLYAPEHEAAWKRIVDFVHAETDAKICMPDRSFRPKGSTQLGWEGMDAPLEDGNWPI
jgi:anthraniloyl-CoA monooxygenase